MASQKDSLVAGLLDLDPLHLLRVTVIMHRAGWAGEDVSGYKADQALRLVLQQGDQSRDAKQNYLPSDARSGYGVEGPSRRTGDDGGPR